MKTWRVGELSTGMRVAVPKFWFAVPPLSTYESAVGFLVVVTIGFGFVVVVVVELELVVVGSSEPVTTISCGEVAPVSRVS